MHIRNAPTKLMKELGYHAGYQYAHDAPEAYIPQEYLPERLRGSRVLRAGSVRVREGDREAAGVVGGAARAREGAARLAADDGGTERQRGGGDTMRRLALAVAAVGGDRWRRGVLRRSGKQAFKQPVVHAQGRAGAAASGSPAARST